MLQTELKKKENKPEVPKHHSKITRIFSWRTTPKIPQHFEGQLYALVVLKQTVSLHIGLAFRLPKNKQEPHSAYLQIFLYFLLSFQANTSVRT